MNLDLPTDGFITLMFVILRCLAGFSVLATLHAMLWKLCVNTCSNASTVSKKSEQLILFISGRNIAIKWINYSSAQMAESSYL